MLLGVRKVGGVSQTFCVSSPGLASFDKLVGVPIAIAIATATHQAYQRKAIREYGDADQPFEALPPELQQRIVHDMLQVLVHHRKGKHPWRQLPAQLPIQLPAQQAQQASAEGLSAQQQGQVISDAAETASPSNGSAAAAPRCSSAGACGVCAEHPWVPVDFPWLSPLKGEHSPSELLAVFEAGIGIARKQQLNVLERKVGSMQSKHADLHKLMVAGAIRVEQGRRATAQAANGDGGAASAGAQAPLQQAEADDESVDEADASLIPGVHWERRVSF